jgi:hypothetical protein
MKSVRMVLRLHVGRLWWCVPVARVGRAHRIRLVRCVQKMLDVGRHGVIDFDHIRFVVRDRAVTGVVREDELVGALRLSPRQGH